MLDESAGVKAQKGESTGCFGSCECSCARVGEGRGAGDVCQTREESVLDVVQSWWTSRRRLVILELVFDIENWK